MKHEVVTGIDIGTHHVKVVIARAGAKQTSDSALPHILGTGYAESRGLRHGYITNEADATRSVKNALRQAEKAAGVEVRRAYIAVSSVGLDELYANGEVITSRADSKVTDSDVEKVLQDSEERIADQIPNRKTLHSIPLSFSIDGEPVLGRPHGMQGTKLEVRTLFITAFEQHIEDTITAVESAGVSVVDVMAGPLAAGLVMLTKSQKRAGCVLVNIGAETVSIAVFENGTPISVKVFPIGANDITNDVALGLKIAPEEAEKIKRGAVSGINFSRKKLDEIVAARFTDIFELVDTHLKRLKRDGLLPAGAIIVGGGANAAPAAELAKTALSLPARVAMIDTGQHSKQRSSVWAVAYGLCMWGANTDHEQDEVGIARKKKNAFLEWLSQFLP